MHVLDVYWVMGLILSCTILVYFCFQIDTQVIVVACGFSQKIVIGDFISYNRSCESLTV